MKKILFALLLVSLFSSCNEEDEAEIDIKEAGQQVGGLMAALDESGGDNSGTFSSLLKQEQKLFAKKVKRPSVFSLKDLFFDKAVATQCSEVNTFSSCTGNQITRDFNDCLVGGSELSGTVDLTFNDNGNLCRLDDTGESVTRSPNFTLLGARGGLLSVTQTGSVGQTLTRTGADSFEFSSDGIRRTVSIGPVVIFDFESQTTSPIQFSGATRATRVMNGGSFQVTNNRTGRVCTVSPSNVSWDSSCTCASSGTWTGSCSDDNSFSLNITSCGSATLTIGEVSEDFFFYRCEDL